MNLDKSNTATPLGTDKIVVNRQDVSEYTCTLDKLKGYKSYVALFSVSNDPAQIPEIVVINNDFETDFIFTSISGGGGGIYWNITPVSNEAIFTNNKTVCFFQNSRFLSGILQFGYTVSWQFLQVNSSLCKLGYDVTPDLGQELAFYNCSLEIRVYN
jgi:hypothetical protein